MSGEIRDSLAQVQELLEEFRQRPNGLSYQRFANKAVDFVKDHGPELMKMLEGKDGR